MPRASKHASDANSPSATCSRVRRSSPAPTERLGPIISAKPRQRLDLVLVERGLAPTRSQAQALLLAGKVRVGNGDGARRDRQAGDLVAADVIVEVAPGPRYVSRGGDKLAGALDAFRVDPTGRTCLDVGASTGGFTDCLLQRGASRVYALDVGRGQLAESLRRDARVVSLERTHAARLDPAADDAVEIEEQVTLAVADVSFISLTKVLGPMVHHLTPGADVVPMVKPQFELSKADVPKGVVHDPEKRALAVANVRASAEMLGFEVLDESESVLVGPSGNHEFFLHLRMTA
jgi:23S rRNA (cytidine1920-2'-O)/16S rRNA (cytidine1409-2'-O)-methyltransferase